MKRLALILAACSVVVFTAGRCAGTSGNGNTDNVDVVDPSDPDTPTPPAEIIKVYSKAYDGFLNVRELPDVASPVVAKILNGPEGAIKLGETAGWTVVKVGDVTGFASSRYLTTTPTKVFTDKDMQKCLEGVWLGNTPMDQKVFMLFPEGVFGSGYSLEGYILAGTWKVEGNKLTVRYIMEDMENDGMWAELPIETEDTFTIESGDKWGNDEDYFKRVKVMSDTDYEITSEKIGVAWYQLSEELWMQMYEGAHLHVKGSYPSGE